MAGQDVTTPQQGLSRVGSLRIVFLIFFLTLVGAFFVTFSQTEKRGYSIEALSELRIIASDFANVTARNVLEGDRALLSAQRLVILDFFSQSHGSRIEKHLQALVAHSPDVLGIGIYNVHGEAIQETPFLHNSDVTLFLPKIMVRHENLWGNPQVFTREHFPELLSKNELIVSRTLIDDQGIYFGYGIAMMNLDAVGERYHHTTLQNEINVRVFNETGSGLFSTQKRHRDGGLKVDDLRRLNDEETDYFENDYLVAVRAEASRFPIYAVAERIKSSIYAEWHGLNTFLFFAYLLIAVLVVVLTELFASFQKIRTLQNAEARKHSRLLMGLKAIAFEFDLSCSRFTFIAPQILELTGCEMAELLAYEGWKQIIHPDDQRHFWQSVSKMDVDQGDEIFDVRIMNQQGDFVWHQANVLRHGENQLQFVQGTLVEITELKNLQSYLQTALENAKQANKAKSEFLAKMSHEIRTPLVGIQGTIDLLKGNGQLPKQLKPVLDDLNLSSENLMGLLNDILDVSKIESGKLVLDSTPSELSADIESVFKLFFIPAQEKRINLTLNNDVPQGAYFAIDALRLKQVLSNLVGNAIKFTQKGTVRIEAKISYGFSGMRLSVMVEDSGIGMDKEEMKKVFKPFEQADSSTTRRFGGTGLGLAITQELVHLMGGTLKARSEKGEGAQFSVELPVKQVEKPEDNESQSSELPCLKILLAEDNVINQRVVRTILENNNMHVDCVDDGRKAVDMARRKTYDLILMDMQMPEMDGEEATRIIRASSHPNAKIPIFAFTADTVKEHRNRYIACGVDDVIIKPINWDNLKKHLSRAV